MICLLHGYLLEGSGSNLWTRAVVQALCRTGHTVHLVCQEAHPEIYDFIAEYRVYGADGGITTRFARPVPYPGRCIMHKPLLGDTLPVYVWDKYEEFPNAVPMVDLPDDAIESYLQRNVDVVRRVVRDNGITVMHANHTVLMSVVAQRVRAETGVPYIVMPHGSALEYAVRPDPRFHAYASAALSEADRVLVSAPELAERVQSMFPGLPELRDKFGEVRVGVDTRGFQPIAREDRPANIEALAATLASLPRGRTPAQTAALHDALAADASPAAVEAAIAAAGAYDGKKPDADAETRLRALDWQNAQTILFVGRIIVAKGIHCLVAAMPEVLARRPEARLLIAGHGPLREPLEALLFALRTGNRELAFRLAAGDECEDRLVSEPMDGVTQYWEGLRAAGMLDDYFDAAQRSLRPDSVQFLGYLTHNELSLLFPCCDAGAFPSMVKESGPMVFLEALSSGSFPVGTYFGGTKGKIDTVAPYLDPKDVEWMKTRPEPEHLTADLARVLPHALAARDRYAATLRRVAEQEFDWAPIALKLHDILLDVARNAPATPLPPPPA